MRVALFGLGYFGQFHLENLMKMDVEIVALYNRGLDNLELASKKLENVKIYQDYQNLIDEVEFDLAVLSLIPNAHFEIEEELIKRKIPFYIEKPIGLDYEKAKEINDLIIENDLMVSVGYQERYSQNQEVLKEFISKNEIGLINAYWLDLMPKPLWWRTTSLSGGQIHEQATHLIDFLVNLFGPVETIYGTSSNKFKNQGLSHDTYDCASSVLKFKTGEIVNLTVANYLEDNIKIGFDMYSSNSHLVYKWRESMSIDNKEYKVGENNHYNALFSFIEAVRTNNKDLIKCTYKDALYVMKLTLLINESIDLEIVIKVAE